jgi:hypothetical protein
MRDARCQKLAAASASANQDEQESKAFDQPDKRAFTGASSALDMPFEQFALKRRTFPPG